MNTYQVSHREKHNMTAVRESIREAMVHTQWVGEWLVHARLYSRYAAYMPSCARHCSNMALIL